MDNIEDKKDKDNIKTECPTVNEAIDHLNKLENKDKKTAETNR